jgi:hypothetical protein
VFAVLRLVAFALVLTLERPTVLQVTQIRRPPGTRRTRCISTKGSLVEQERRSFETARVFRAPLPPGEGLG